MTHHARIVSGDIMQEMYSLYFPETQRAWNQIMDTSKVHEWLDMAWDGRQDDLPFTFLNTWQEWSGLPVSGFEHRYVGHGSAEIIRELLTPMVPLFPPQNLLILAGEYAGFHYSALSRGLQPPIKIDINGNDFDPIPESWSRSVSAQPVFWISQPSARNGEYIDLGALMDHVLATCPRAKFIVDVCYHGLGHEPQHIPELVRPDVQALIFSMSKLFGMYKMRVGGVFSRRPILGLEFNKHFNSYLGLKLAVHMMNSYRPGEIPQMYRGYQQQLVQQLIEAGEVPADTLPSNTLLLAHSKTSLDDRYKRAAECNRYCLSPGLHRLINQSETA